MAARDLSVPQGADATWSEHAGAARRSGGWLWASPWILGFLLFTLGPMIASFYLAFTRYSITNPAEWIGLDNFTTRAQRARTGSSGRHEADVHLGRVMVPIGLAGSLALRAAAQPGPARRRTPSGRSSSCRRSRRPWRWRWSGSGSSTRSSGRSTTSLAAASASRGRPGWFSDARLGAAGADHHRRSGPDGGGSAMMIFLAGLQGVPRELLRGGRRSTAPAPGSASATSRCR